MANIKIEVSPGDFFDRLTILRIKKLRSDAPQTDAAQAKLAAFEALRRTHFHDGQELEALEEKLKKRNEDLWDLENRVRTFTHPLQSSQMEDYVSVARAIFSFNEDRSALKREIDLLFSDDSDEIKSYDADAGNE
ncbi:hypothetical protein [Roseibium sp. MMSF_3544]|uniref:hypothetical protein n=1 Tax=unclassified Roseibium TaxID=2629323 RepID=UPI00273F7B69|nr:hypothetical protein [Roseibium sp. MMSF_3544]